MSHPEPCIQSRTVPARPRRLARAGAFALAFACAFGGPVCARELPFKAVSKTVPSGRDFRLDWAYSLNPDCTSAGDVEIRISQPAQHGTISLKHAPGFPSPAAGSPYEKCATKRVRSTEIWYRPQPGYVGADSVTIFAIFPNGDSSNRRFDIDVR